MPLIATLLHQILIAMPLFVLIALGWLLVRWRHWPESITEAINRLVFRVALPAMQPGRLPHQRRAGHQLRAKHH